MINTLRFGGGRASGALSNTATTINKTEELITQLRESFETQIKEKSDKIFEDLNKATQEQKLISEALKKENEELKVALNTTKQALEQQRTDLESKGTILEAKFTEQDKKVKEALDVTKQALEKQETDLKSTNDILDSKTIEQEEKIFAIVNGLNSLMTYSIKTNFEQCDLIVNIKSLTEDMAPEIQEQVIVGLQKEVAKEAIGFFEKDQSLFEPALLGVKSLLTDQSLAGHDGENS